MNEYIHTYMHYKNYMHTGMDAYPTYITHVALKKYKHFLHTLVDICKNAPRARMETLHIYIYVGASMHAWMHIFPT